MKTWKARSSIDSVIVEAETVKEALRLAQEKLPNAICFIDDISHRVVDLSNINDPTMETTDEDK